MRSGRIKHGILVSHRLRSDLRGLGEDPLFSIRLRHRLMVEKVEAKII